jgi:flagellar hook-length control protein FliK
MPTSTLPALTPTERPQSGRRSSGAESAAERGSERPFNQLLASSQQKSAGVVKGEAIDAGPHPDGKVASEVDANGNVSSSGNVLPVGGKELPLESLDVAGLTESLDGEAVVNWQQVQLDWAKLQGAAKNEGGLNLESKSSARLSEVVLLQQGQQAKAGNAVSASLQPRTELTNGSEVVLLQQGQPAKAENTVSASLQSRTELTNGVASGLGFGEALKSVGLGAEGVALTKTASQKADLLNASSDLVDLANLTQLKTSSSVSASRAPLSMPITQSLVDDPAWGQAMAARIGFMANNGVHTATLQLHPAELGSIHIQLSIQGDNASVQFQTQSSDTGDLVEKMLPRLSSGMEGQGLRLDEVKVTHNPNLGNGAFGSEGQQLAGESAAQGDSKRSANAAAGLSGAEEEAGIHADSQQELRVSRAVDYYA